MAFNANYKRKLASISHRESDESDYYNDSDSDFDVASVASSSISKNPKLGSKGHATAAMARRPTRIPNPKVSNRNALLARENRLRKKQYVEELEQEIETVKLENKKLRQMMKKKNGEISKLELDRTYLKSILVNRTEIFSLLKTIQNTRIPIATPQPPMRLNDYRRRDSLHGSRSSFSSASPISEEHNDFGLDIVTMTPQSINGWDTLLSEQMADYQSAHVYCPATEEAEKDKVNNTKIESEHNYFESDQKADDVGVQKPGICLHITDSRVSLELCASCHQQAQQPSWIDDEEL